MSPIHVIMMKNEQYFRDKVKGYYKSNGRIFFWRYKKLTPFQVMITELFLKKTRAETVEKYVYGFLKEFPSSAKILRCKSLVLSKKVKPLGLGRQRTTALKKASSYIKNRLGNCLPQDLDEISKIPYVGLYTANATMCFGFNKRLPILDINTSRIIARFFSIRNNLDLRNNVELQDKSKELLPRNRFKEYNWGLLDLGATICKSKPLCYKCTLRTKCNYYLNRIKQGSRQAVPVNN